jgi:uncharacterized protein involved in cysteine biosynthesis
MLSSLFKALAQLSDPALRRILGIGVGSALACWLALAAGAHLALGRVRLFDADWADTGAGLVLGLGAFIVPLLFFSALATFVSSFWLDQAADVVEARHYPQLAPPRHLGWGEILAASGRFLVVMVLVTAIAAPVYVALFLFGLGLILNYAVNGYLLGREYFELAAARHLEAEPARLLMRNHLGRVWLGGAVINFCFQVPILNLAAPIIATAFMVHEVQALLGRPGRV